MPISKFTSDKVKERADIVEVVGDYIHFPCHPPSKSINALDVERQVIPSSL
jgi:hypothetical protein